MAYSVLEAVTETKNVLGRGSYGEVIEVKWCGTICAAKRLHDIFLTSLSQAELDKMVKDVEKECQTWSNLKHPNIVQVLGCYYQISSRSRVPILVMERMDTSLRHYLEVHTKKDFLLLDKVSVLLQVAQGLCYLHSQKPRLVHHDLSPNNILLNDWTFLTKLTDFGMTRAINQSKLTRQSSVKGTLAFMPPEALYIPPRYTEKLDIFSYGACIATALTHQWPSLSHPVIYEGRQRIVLTELDRRKAQIEMLSVKEKNLFLPLIKRCLEDDTSFRPNSKELVREMMQIDSACKRSNKAGSSAISRAQQAMSQLPLEQQQKARLQQQLEIKSQCVLDLEKIIQRQRRQLEKLEKELQQQQLNVDKALVTQWEEQHQGITCVDFPKWKAENDEENQQKGPAAFLKENMCNQECPLCTDTYFIDDMVTMLHCACSVCKDCFKRHYSVVAREKTLGHFNCLLCSQPDLSATDIDKDDYLTLFSVLLKVHLSNDDYQLFQKKATDYVLLKDPNFRWCPSCGQAFIHEPPAAGNLRIACPHCDKNSCFNCKKVWEEQHQGITCVDFAKWKAENDEENQQKGPAAFLKENMCNQECPVCSENIFIDDMVTMPHCACSVCKDCFKGHYSLVAREQTLGHFNCLVCGQPDLSATDIDKDDYLTLFSVLLQVHLPDDDYQLFQKKATDYALSQDANFRWCPSCGQAFIHEPPAAGNLRIACPHCDKNSCFNCKKVWEEQHQGITCVDFTKWKAENDEENQQKGLAAFLKENGIECPKCHYRYDLAKGGCLHFTCTQCFVKTEFCGGCGSIFDKNCHKFKACTTKAFHTHHPRDCLFYIRDWEVERLQKALEDSKIEFDTDPPEKQVNAAKEGGIEEAGLLRCRVILQKEVGDDKVDEECGDGCEAGHAGLCKKHYKEYLVCKLNEASVDPADFMDLGELTAVLGREEKELPPKNNPNEGDDDYLKRMREHVKKELPLEKRGALKF